MSLVYLTDIEGQLGKLESFARGNPHVTLDGGRLQVAPGTVFVFGGDIIDRGPGARRLITTLLEAKLRQPEQVVLLAGNRDLNKLRLPRELGGKPLKRTPEALKHGPRPALLRWIFVNTMGAPDAFAHRQAELRALGLPASDDDVVQSVLDDVAPDGPLRRYLLLSQLAYRHGQTLFVHGGLTEASLGAVPGRQQPSPPVDVMAWAAALNAWHADMLAAFVADPGAAPDVAAWQPLIAYQAPLPGGRANPGSVVYGRTADADNNLHLPGDQVIDTLLDQGIRRVVIGHTPSGDSPSLLRRGDFELVCADNSHARHELASQVFMTDDALEVRASVCLDDERDPRPVQLLRRAGDDGPLGLRERDGGALVCGVLDDGRYLTYRTHPGYQVSQQARAANPAWLASLEDPT